MVVMTIRTVFEECQRGFHGHAKLIKSLTAIYNQMKLDEFWNEFLHHLRYSMVHFRREPAVERTIDFVAKFATSLGVKATPDAEDGENRSTEEEDEEEQEEDAMPPFLCKFFDFLLENHDASGKAVRYRCCQLINRLLSGLGPDAHIDDDLYDRLYDGLLMRMKDKFPIVRLHAVHAVCRLQDPAAADCPIVNAYLFLMGCDSSADVRRAVLSCISPSTKTLPKILHRTRDVKDFVRRTAYQVLAEKVHIKALTIAQRLRILKEGLKDRSEAVRETCASKLIQAWLRSFQGNALELLESLDVESSASTCQLMLDTIFKRTSPVEIVDNFDLLDDNFLVPIDKLTCESAFYWRCVCTYVQKQGPSADEALDKLLPNITVFTQYLKEYQAKMAAMEELDEQLESMFIFEQLLSIAQILDFSDEVGRRNMDELVRELLVKDSLGEPLVKPVLRLYALLVRDPVARVNHLVEAISDIKQPITMVETSLGQEAQRKVQIKLAGISVEQNELKEELGECIKNEDFSRADQIKKALTQLEQSRVETMTECEPSSQEVRTEKDDPATLVKCMAIACEMLEPLTITALPPSILTLVETLVLPGVQNYDPAVRNLAIRSLGIACLRSVDLASQHLLLFLQVANMDLDEVKVMALKVIVDMLHVHGLGVFKIDGEADTPLDNLSGAGEDEDGEVAGTGNTQEAASILTYLISLLDSPSCEIRTVCAEGLAKLMLSWRVVSARLFSKLLLLWYNPVTEDDTRLRHCLGTFFTFYAFASRSNQDVVEQAVLPTLNTLFQAPAISPLADVKDTNVAEFLVQLTNPTHLLAKDPTSESSCHDSLAVNVCNEILNDPTPFSVRTLSRILNQVQLTHTNPTVLKDLSVLTDSMLQVVKDKPSIKSIEKFSKTVSAMLGRLAEVKQATPGSVLRSAPMARITVEQEEEEDAEMTSADPTEMKVSPVSSTDNNAAVPESMSDDANDTDLSVFASPTPVRRSTRSRRTRTTNNHGESMRKNLDEDLSAEADGPSSSATKPRSRPNRKVARRCPLGGLDDNQVA